MVNGCDLFFFGFVYIANVMLGVGAFVVPMFVVIGFVPDFGQLSSFCKQ